MGVLPEASLLPSDFPSTLLLEEGYLYLSKFRSGNRCAFGLRASMVLRGGRDVCGPCETSCVDLLSASGLGVAQSSSLLF